MSVEHIRGLCNTHLNRPVEVRMLDGGIHRGVISRVDGDHVWLRPLDDGAGPGGGGGWDGPGVYWWGFGWGFPLALAGIVGITALAAAAFWW